MNSEDSFPLSKRRDFLKSITATTLGGSVLPGFAVEHEAKEYHICQGLNTEQEGKYSPGTAPGPNLPQKDLHSCEGGNTCAGLGGCGTGEYARQYWIGENTCANNAGSKWNGTGGCGVPIGTGNTGYVRTQLNSAAPAEGQPADFLGQPVWNIARSRFECKMVGMKKSFETPANLNPPHSPKVLIASSWKVGQTYQRPEGMPAPYPTPMPARLQAPNATTVPAFTKPEGC